jgi:hypothetical protein
VTQQQAQGYLLQRHSHSRAVQVFRGTVVLVTSAVAATSTLSRLHRFSTEQEWERFL